MATDSPLRDFRTIAIALGSDPDLAQARASQLQREDESLGTADAYLLVLRELTDGQV